MSKKAIQRNVVKLHKDRQNECLLVLMTHPARRVADQTDEQRREFGPAHFWRRGRGDGHEALGAGLPHAPHVIRTQLEKPRQLTRKHRDTASTTPH